MGSEMCIRDSTTIKPSLGTLKASGGRLCQRFVNTSYIMRAICKVTFVEAVDESNPASSSGTKIPSNDLFQVSRLQRQVGRVLGSRVQLEPRLYG